MIVKGHFFCYGYEIDKLFYLKSYFDKNSFQTKKLFQIFCEEIFAQNNIKNSLLKIFLFSFKNFFTKKFPILIPKRKFLTV